MYRLSCTLIYHTCRRTPHYELPPLCSWQHVLNCCTSLNILKPSYLEKIRDKTLIGIIHVHQYKKVIPSELSTDSSYV